MNYYGLTGSQIIVKKLMEWGINKVSGYSGGAIMSLIDQFHKSKKNKIKLYVHSHEQNCGHAATGFAKSSGKMGVCIVTSGPGLTNMITPMLDSTNDSTPLMVISGQVNTNVMGTLAFQECPATEITKPVTKFSYCIKNIEEVPYIMEKAYKIANDGKKGTVHIDLPKNISNEIFENKRSYIGQQFYKYIFDKEKAKFKNSFDKDYMKKISNIINQSSKPILYIGQGCKNSLLLTELINKTGIPVTTTIHNLGVIDYRHPLCLKWLGMHGYAPANFAIQESDCIICIGARFDDRTTGEVSKYAPNAKGRIIHVNIDQNEFCKTVQSNFPVLDKSDNFIKNIIPLLNKRRINKWYKQIDIWKDKHPFYFENSKENELKIPNVLSEINEQLDKKKDVILTAGVGTHQMQTAQFIDWRPNWNFLSSGSLGVMGAGIPYAIGAKMANKKAEVICIDGDSSSLMTLSDLKTIKEYNIPVKIAIMNNESQSMVEVWEELFFDNRITATKNNNNPDFKLLAESFGIKGLYCDNIENLSSTVNSFLNETEAVLCEFKVKSEICVPLVKPGCALDDMLLYDDYHNRKINMTGEAPN